MRLMIKTISLGLLSSALSAHLFADEQNNTLFVGAGASYLQSETIDEGFSDEEELSFPALELVVGYKFNRFLGVDARIGAGVGDTSADPAAGTELDGADSIDITVDSYQSIYFRPELSNREAKLYALIGYTQADLSVEVLDSAGEIINSNTSSESGNSYGLGAGWFVEDNVNVNLEYRVLVDSDDNEISVITLGFDYRFRL